MCPRGDVYRKRWAMSGYDQSRQKMRAILYFGEANAAFRVVEPFISKRRTHCGGLVRFGCCYARAAKTVRTIRHRQDAGGIAARSSEGQTSGCNMSLARQHVARSILTVTAWLAASIRRR